ncbi:hypothetical protein LMH87_011157 [Akanthomyces muscarius]|uniref:Cell wall galactomannoprotein n=1 Tax=Akanthomyces muscarius TaxID=2231603 RepID=A0A9W8QAY3_AKAMU|nr:hypothetical protein LMH87_011157 [Akanthomyces muscarius]KAJ4150405.1 hypothetical protein LMH87_011157 [Akanthomyces muscarius]
MKFHALLITIYILLGQAQAGLFGTTPLQDLRSAVEGMDSTLSNWGGGALGLIPIAVQAEALQTRIRNTKTSFQTLGARTEQMDGPILKDGQAALDSLGHAMTTVASSAGKFRKVPMGVPIINLPQNEIIYLIHTEINKGILAALRLIRPWQLR